MQMIFIKNILLYWILFKASYQLIILSIFFYDLSTSFGPGHYVKNLFVDKF